MRQHHLSSRFKIFLCDKSRTHAYTGAVRGQIFHKSNKSLHTSRTHSVRLVYGALSAFQFEATTKMMHRCAARPFTALAVVMETRLKMARSGRLSTWKLFQIFWAPWVQSGTTTQPTL